MTYEVEIIGLVTVEAESKEDAIEQVKQLFEEETLTWENLFFSCTADDEF